MSDVMQAIAAALGLPPGLDDFDSLLPELDPATEALLRGSFRERWGDWHLPPPLVAELFQVAAAYWRAQPWVPLTNAQLLSIDLPSGGTRVASVLGNGGTEFGIAVYQDIGDYVAQVSAPSPSDGLAAIQHPLLSMTFDAGDELPPAMLREVQRAGWDVAHPFAYPMLMALKSVTVTEDDARMLITLLRVIPAFVREYHGILDGTAAATVFPVTWTDRATGATVRYNGYFDHTRPGPPYHFTEDPSDDFDAEDEWDDIPELSDGTAIAHAGFGDLPARYRFILNPYDTTRLTRCPSCSKATHPRKFPLCIVIDGYGVLVFGETCRYCSPCELIIAHQNELEEGIDGALTTLAPEHVGRPYAVVGTVERPAWKAGLAAGAKGTPTAAMRAHTADFKEVLGLEMVGGWGWG